MIAATVGSVSASRSPHCSQRRRWRLDRYIPARSTCITTMMIRWSMLGPRVSVLCFNCPSLCLAVSRQAPGATDAQASNDIPMSRCLLTCDHCVYQQQRVSSAWRRCRESGTWRTRRDGASGRGKPPRASCHGNGSVDTPERSLDLRSGKSSTAISREQAWRSLLSVLVAF